MSQFTVHVTLAEHHWLDDQLLTMTRSQSGMIWFMKPITFLGSADQISLGCKQPLSRNFDLRLYNAPQLQSRCSEVSLSILQKRQISFWTWPMFFKWYLLGQCPVTRPVYVQRALLLSSKIFLVLFAFGVINLLDWVHFLTSIQLVITFCSSQHLSSIFTAQFGIPQNGSGPTNCEFEPRFARSSAFSFPSMPQCPGTQYKFTEFDSHNCRNERIHFQTSFDVHLYALNDTFQRNATPRGTDFHYQIRPVLGNMPCDHVIKQVLYLAY